LHNDAGRMPRHLTVAVDTSASMRWHGRLAAARQALLDVVARLGPHDRLSLVTYSESAEVLAADATQADAGRLSRIVERIAPGRGTNFGAGLSAACAASADGELPDDGPDDGRRQVVVLTDGPGPLDELSARRIRKMLAQTAQYHIELTFVDLSHAPDPDLQLARFAAVAGGQVHQADGPGAIRHLLMERLTGRSQVVAADARLRVTFNPRAVASYRLIGHEPTAGLVSGPLAADLRSGETATALFELSLLPRGASDVAVAELTWRDAATGARERVTQRISRVQFATSLAESAISLQAAALAAETAELLRGSFYTPAPSHSLDRVRAEAQQVHPRLRRQAEFSRLLELVDWAAKL
jgi:Ca-activated chloride channel family protein